MKRSQGALKHCGETQAANELEAADVGTAAAAAAVAARLERKKDSERVPLISANTLIEVVILPMT